MIIDVVEQINQSNLPPASKANALALLAMAHHDNGHLAIDWQDLAAAFGHISRSRSRRHLGLMQEANLIHYSSNGDGVVYINFKAWLRISARGRAENDHSEVEKRAPTRDPESTTDDAARVGARKTTTPRAENDHPTRENGSLPIRAPARSDCLIDRSSDQPDEINQSITPATTGPQRTPRLPWEAPLSYRFLTDPRVAMRRRDAERLSTAHPFHHIRDAVAHWLSNRKAAGGRFEDYPGIVVYWLDNSDETVIPVMSEEFQRSDLYRDYRTPQEIAEEQEQGQKAAPEPITPRPPAAPAPAPEPGTPEHVWWQVRGEIELEQGGAFARWLDATRVLAHDQAANAFTVTCRPHAHDWLNHRLARQIARKLTIITGRPAAIKFVAVQETQGIS
jgi:hypothetical protein